MNRKAFGSLPLFALAITLLPQAAYAQEQQQTTDQPSTSNSADDDFHNRGESGTVLIVSAPGVNDLDVLAGTSVVEGLELQRNMDGQVGEVLEDLPGVSATGLPEGGSRPTRSR